MTSNGSGSNDSVTGLIRRRGAAFHTALRSLVRGGLPIFLSLLALSAVTTGAAAQPGDATEVAGLIDAVQRAVSTTLRQPSSAFTVATPRW